MQGQLLGWNNKGSARVFIRGVTEGDGFTNRWVPQKFVDKGKPWHEDIADWQLNVHLPTYTFNTQDWTTTSLPDTSVLGTTVTRLITAFRQSPARFAPAKLTDFIDNANIAVLSRTIMQGIKDAGLYDILSQSAPFSAKDLVVAARYKIRDSSSSNKAGVYARFHDSTDKVKYWKAKSSYCYVGKTNDFGERHGQHQYTKTSYGDLTRNSSNLVMIALCILDADSEHEAMFFLVEQIYVCLLETYREGLLKAGIANTDMLKYYQAAKYFTDISKEVFRLTGWQGGIGRGPNSFGIQYGANCSSPLLEYGTKFDKHLFIRTDADIKDEKTGSVVPMAFYRRANHVVVSKKEWSTTDPRAVPNHMVLAKKLYKPDKSVIQFGFSIGKKATAADIPLPGTSYELVIEVRKDGTSHPYAWARCSEIGRFENWNQANSFAVRIEWEYPANSGKWRSKYLQATNFIIAQLDKQVPGSLTTYAKAISFLQWLTGATPNHSHLWIPRLSGSARVLFSEFDCFNQTITFKEPTDPIPMLSGQVRPYNVIKTHMNQSRYKLEHVDGTFRVFPAGMKGPRTRCDTCLIIGEYLSKGTMPDTSCVQYQNSRGCTNCRALGRPCCSWTKNLRATKTDTVRTADETSYSNTVQAALVSLPTTNIPDSLQSYSQTLRKLESSEQIEEDGSDYEDGDEFKGDVDEF
jgi:hypothetical protein